MEAGGSRLKSLIVTADDFGFSRGVNQAIVRAHREGIVTAASLMVTGDAAEEAVELARANPSLSVGLHLVLVSGRSALAPSEIPKLVDGRGRFRAGPVAFGLRLQFDRGAREQVRREIREQLTLYRKTGLKLSHVDGHLHMHMHPVVLAILAGVSRELGIPAIRLPSEQLSFNLAFDRHAVLRKLAWSWIFARLRAHGERLLRPAGIAFADRVYGLLQTGRVTEAYWLDLLPRLSAPVTEIYCHPDLGPNGAGPEEFAAVLSPRVRQAVAEAGLTLSGHPEPAPPERPAFYAGAVAPRVKERPS